MEIQIQVEGTQATRTTKGIHVLEPGNQIYIPYNRNQLAEDGENISGYMVDVRGNEVWLAQAELNRVSEQRWLYEVHEVTQIAPTNTALGVMSDSEIQITDRLILDRGLMFITFTEEDGSVIPAKLLIYSGHLQEFTLQGLYEVLDYYSFSGLLQALYENIVFISASSGETRNGLVRIMENGYEEFERHIISVLDENAGREKLEEAIRQDYLYGAGSSASAQSIDAMIKAMYPFYHLLYRGDEDAVDYTDPRFLLIDLISDVVVGSGYGIMVHNQPEIFTLGRRLYELVNSSQVRFGLIACPDWGYEERGESVHYTMDKLNGGVPYTVERAIRYLEVLSRRARSGLNVRMNVYLPQWEVQRNLDSVNEGVTEAEAITLLESTEGEIEVALSDFDHEHCSGSVEMFTPEEFEVRVEKAKSLLLRKYRSSLESMLDMRRAIFPDMDLDGLAQDIAEQLVAFEQAAAENDILIVATSPTIARLCLGKILQVPYIQISHGYVG